MVLGGPAALAVRLLTAFLLARPSSPPSVPERAPIHECVCICAGAGGETAWAFLAGLLSGAALVLAVLLAARTLPTKSGPPRSPKTPDAGLRYRPRHAAGRPSP